MPPREPHPRVLLFLHQGPCRSRGVFALSRPGARLQGAPQPSARGGQLGNDIHGGGTLQDSDQGVMATIGFCRMQTSSTCSVDEFKKILG